MNIFYLDSDPVKCAAYHVDKHIIKMPLETIQILSTAYRFYNSNVNDNIYKSTHINHPCSIWVRESKQNFEWLIELFHALHYEWNYRYDHNKTHKSCKVLNHISSKNFPDIGFTPIKLAIPDELKNENPILAYRNYYKMYKRHIATWKKRGEPEWWT